MYFAIICSLKLLRRKDTTYFRDPQIIRGNFWIIRGSFTIIHVFIFNTNDRELDMNFQKLNCDLAGLFLFSHTDLTDLTDFFTDGIPIQFRLCSDVQLFIRGT